MLPDKREKFIFRALKGMGWWLAGELICVIFVMCMLMFMMKFMAVKVFGAFACLIIVNGLFFNYAYNCAVRDKNLVKFHGAYDDKKMSLKLAVAAPLPQYIMWIVLLLSKLGIIGDIFRYYVLANIQCLPWVDLFTSEREITALSWGGLFGLLVLMLAAPAVIIVTYECTIRELDIKALLLYGKKK